VRPAAAALLALALGAALAAPGGARAEPETLGDGVAITLSGGASLGAYEAGLTWALVRWLRQGADAARGAGVAPPGLVAAAGTSAGALNAFLAAALWCERGEGAGGTVDENPLLDAWRSLDLAGLLPEDAGRYRRGDALLSAEPLELAGERVLARTLSAGAPPHAPRCRVPLGVVVTQATPEQREAAGLTTPVQRFALAWSVEADDAGRLRIVRQLLPPWRDGGEAVLELAGPAAGGGAPAPVPPEAVAQGILASSAVPLAFAPRALCTCSARCPAGAEATAADCPGRAGGLSCAGAPAPGGLVPRLCRRDYVDGGVFDNVPVGLTVDLVEATRAPAPLRPVWYVLVDPDRRRFAPAPVGEPEVAGRTPVLSEQLQLLGRLVGTARASELSRAVRSGGWSRTTRRLLRDAAEVFAGFAELHAALAQAIEPGVPAAQPALAAEPAAPLPRAAWQRRLAACLERLAATPPRAGAHPEPCAEALLATPVATAAGSEPPDPALALEVARGLAAMVRTRAGGADFAPRDLLASQAAVLVHVRLATVATLLLAEEVDRVALREPVPERLASFRDAALAPVRAAPALGRLSARLAGAVLDARLEALAHRAPEPVALEAGRVRAALAALPPGAAFGQGTLGALPARMASALEGAPDDPAGLGGAWQALESVLLARGRLGRLQERAAGLVEDAERLVEAGGSERALVVSTRFAPLAGEQLSSFAGFLDEPLRLHDWYAGVYEAARAVAVELCERQGADEAARAYPERQPGAPALLDLWSADTQRCVGAALHEVVDGLGLSRSRRARHAVATLGGLELAAWVGEGPARLLRAEPAWSWLDALEEHDPGDPVDAALHALTSRRVPCRPADREEACPADLAFDELLAALREAGYRPASPEMRLLLESPDLFWAHVARRVSGRALEIELERERATGERSPPWVRTGLGTVSLLARGEAQRGPTPRLELDPSTLPDEPGPGQGGWRLAAAHAVPYRLSLDVARGGFGLAWLEPALRMAPWLSVQSVLQPVVLEAQDARWSSTAGALALARAAGLSFGAGPLATFRWRGGVMVGFEARLVAFQDRAGISVGLRDLGPGRPEASWYLSLFAADLNGLLWWLTPLGGGGR
jgi:predicted acylesterase/phospholipase RssA